MVEFAHSMTYAITSALANGHEPEGKTRMLSMQTPEVNRTAVTPPSSGTKDA
jgi:hypothetical protein